MHPHRLKVVTEPSKRTENTIPSNPPGGHIRPETARRILAGELKKVAGPDPIRGGALILVVCMAAGLIAIMVAYAYS